MKNLLNTALLITLLLTIAYSVIMFGAATIDLALPLFGAGALMAFLWAAKLFTNSRVSFIKSPVHWTVLAFVAYAGVRWLTSPVAVDSRVEFIYICFYALIYFLVTSNLYHRRDLTMMFLALMVLAFGEAIYGIWQAVTLSKQVLFAERPAMYTGRAGGTFINPNHFASFLALVFGLLLARIVLHRPAAKAAFGAYAGPKIIEGYIALVALAGITFSGSRANWIAMGICLVAFVMWAWLPGGVSRYVVLGLAVMLVLASMIIFNAPVVRERVSEIINVSQETGKLELRDQDFGFRTTMWSASTAIMGEHPVFGTGPATWEWFFPPHRDLKLQEHPRNAHNDLLQLGAEYGVVGLLLVAAFFGAFFWHVAQLSTFANYSDQRAFAVGSGYSVAVILLHSLADFPFHLPGLALLVVVLVAVAVGMESGDRYSVRVQMQPRTQRALGGVLVVVGILALWLGAQLVRVEIDLSAANELKKTANYDEAAERYRRVLARDAKRYEAHKGMAEIYLGLAGTNATPATVQLRGDLARQALAALDQSAALNPYDPEIHVLKGTAHGILGDRVRAKAEFEIALQRDPNRHKIMLAAGRYFMDAGERELGVKLLERSQSIIYLPETYYFLLHRGAIK